MNISRRNLIFPLLICCIALIPLTSCDDDSTSPPGVEPTLENIWPAADGNSWSFSITDDRYEDMGPQWYATEAQVPDMPSLDDLYADLQDDITATPVSTPTGELELAFDGTTVLPTDFTVRNLTSIFVDENDSPDSPYPLKEMRWQRSGGRIAGYGASESEVVWIYMDGEPGPGPEFELQLIPGLADNIFLRGKVKALRTCAVLGEDVRNCVECVYAIDMGVVARTDEGGQVTGYGRPYIYGLMVYAPEIGPAYCRERRILQADEILQDTIPEFSEIEAVLIDADFGTE